MYSSCTSLLSLYLAYIYIYIYIYISKVARDHYLKQIMCTYNRFGDSSEVCIDRLDPYQLAVDQWIDDISRWPPMEFPDLYSYLIETPGEFMKEKLKAFKSLDALQLLQEVRESIATCTSPNSQRYINCPLYHLSLQWLGTYCLLSRSWTRSQKLHLEIQGESVSVAF